MSYQPEERYWTDYLRIALPVVGLLLMLGLFWYWASAVIGNDDDNEPKKTPTQAVVITEESLSPTSTSEIRITAENVTATATNDNSGGNENPTEEATEEPTEETPEIAGKGFEEGELVMTTEGDVNLRVGKSTEGDPVLVLDEATELQVIEPGTEEDENGRVWVGVRTEGGEEGYVSDEFLVSAE